MDNNTSIFCITKISVTSISRSITGNYKLYQNYPNPFNPETRIEYEISKVVNVEIIIYNILGQKVKTLVDEERGPGVYRSIWDGRNNYGQPAASGVYLYKLKSENFIEIKKMTLLK